MTKKHKKTITKKDTKAKYILIVILLLLAGYLVYFFFIREERKPEFRLSPDRDRIEKPADVQTPEFRKHGELNFISRDGRNISGIDIELADTPDKRAQGLMYRKSMGENHGMLFIFPFEGPQSFWMKNTVIPLDIIFVNKQKEIVKIHRNTTPFSERSLQSEKPAIYVVEVNAGYCEKLGIREGDRIEFDLK